MKNRQITGTMLTGSIGGGNQGAESFCYVLSIYETTVDAVAVGVLAVVDWALTLATSQKVGLQPRR